jgi:hypothetical protein
MMEDPPFLEKQNFRKAGVDQAPGNNRESRHRVHFIGLL